MLQHFKKNPQIANPGTEGCINLAEIGCELLPQKVTFEKEKFLDREFFLEN